MKTGFVQTLPEFGKIRENTDRVIEKIESMGDVDLVVLPELFSTGYRFTSPEEALELSETATEGYAPMRLAEAARDLGAFIAAGFCEREGDRAYNSSLIVGPEGLVGTYRKIHLFASELKCFTTGVESPPVFDCGGVKVGLMICFDWIFPETARTLALKGAEVIAHPSNLVLAHCPQAMITRCIENRVFAVTCNRIGTEERVEGEKLRFIGQSEVVTPKGEVLVRAAVEDEETAVVEIDPTQAMDKHVTPENDIFADRRTGLYKL